MTTHFVIIHDKMVFYSEWFTAQMAYIKIIYLLHTEVPGGNHRTIFNQTYFLKFLVLGGIKL